MSVFSSGVYGHVVERYCQVYLLKEVSIAIHGHVVERVLLGIPLAGIQQCYLCSCVEVCFAITLAGIQYSYIQMSQRHVQVYLLHVFSSAIGESQRGVFRYTSCRYLAMLYIDVVERYVQVYLMQVFSSAIREQQRGVFRYTSGRYSVSMCVSILCLTKKRFRKFRDVLYQVINI